MKAATCTGSIMTKPNPAHQSPVLLGSTGGPAPLGACSNPSCNTTAGSSCVYVSGGLARTPRCTCSTVADCPSLQGNTVKCHEGVPALPKNYKDNVCNYIDTSAPRGDTGR